ncbi:unnamed protein product, partial [Rhizophagus irregularis]
MARSNRVITAHGPTPSYRVRIWYWPRARLFSPLLWVIYIDPLLTVLKNEKMDPYSLVLLRFQRPYLLIYLLMKIYISIIWCLWTILLWFPLQKKEWNICSQLLRSFIGFNNTSANHNKYVLATNAISNTQDLSPIVFNLTPSSLNATATITVTPIPMSSSFRFLG